MITIVNSRFKMKKDEESKNLFKKYSEIRYRIRKEENQTLEQLEVYQFYLLTVILHTKKQKLYEMELLSEDIEKKREYKELVYTTLNGSSTFIELNKKFNGLNSKADQLVNRIRQTREEFLMIGSNQNSLYFEESYVKIVKEYYELKIQHAAKKLILKYKKEDRSFHYRLLIREHFNMLMTLSKNSEHLYEMLLSINEMYEKSKIEYKCNILSYRLKVLCVKKLNKSKRLRQVLLELSRIEFYLLTGKRTYDENTSRFEYLLEFKFHFLRLETIEFEINYFKNETEDVAEPSDSSKTPLSFRQRNRLINSEPNTPRVSAIQTLQNSTNILYEAIVNKITKIFEFMEHTYINIQKTKLLTEFQLLIKSNEHKLILLTKMEIKKYEIMLKTREITVFKIKSKMIKTLYEEYLTTIKIYPEYKKLARKQIEYVICGILMIEELHNEITNKTVVITLETPFRIPQKLGLQAQKEKINFYLKLIKAEITFVEKALEFSAKLDNETFKLVDEAIESHQFVQHFHLYETATSENNIFKHLYEYRSTVLDFIAFIYDYLNVMILKNKTFSSFRHITMTAEQMVSSFIEKNKYEMQLLQEMGDLKELLENVFCTIFTVVILYDPVFVEREASFFPEVIDEEEHFRVYSGW